MSRGYCFELPPPRVSEAVAAERARVARYLAGQRVESASAPKPRPLAPSARRAIRRAA